MERWEDEEEEEGVDWTAGVSPACDRDGRGPQVNALESAPSPQPSPPVGRWGRGSGNHVHTGILGSG